MVLSMLQMYKKKIKYCVKNNKKRQLELLINIL